MEYSPPEEQEPTHLGWMSQAMNMAQEAMDACEVPVGCVFVRDGRVIAQARNRTNELRNVRLFLWIYQTCTCSGLVDIWFRLRDMLSWRLLMPFSPIIP